MNGSTTLTELGRKIRQSLRLRGPLAVDPTARVLHALVVGTFLLFMLDVTVVVPFFVFGNHLVPRNRLSEVTIAFMFSALFTTWSLLRRGSLRRASLVYLAATWLIATFWIAFSGGIHSAGLVLYIALPTSAAWLLGFPAALWSAAVCLSTSLVLALLEIAGLPPPKYFAGAPLGTWLVVLFATIIATVPVAQVLRIYRAALAASRRDVAERIRAEKELLKHQEHLEELVEQRTAELVQARDEAQAADRAKSTFLARMSHELRTPLNAILGFSSLMREQGNVTGRQRRDLDIINRSGEHLLELIDDVLDVCKLEAGRVTIDSKFFDLRKLIRDVTDMMRVRAVEKNLALFVDPGSEFPNFIRSDASKLRQILINLIGNAVKYSETGEVWVRLTAKPLQACDEILLTIEVEDTGIGIAAEDQARIFEPFVQAGNGATRKGTGLGLSITRQLVNLMKGTIAVRSAPGKGSLFRVEIPVQKSGEPEGGATSISEKVVSIEPGQPEYRILIVEDETVNALLLERLLAGTGFSVRLAESGPEGIELFQSWHPHFIWMDRRMPLMDGVETARRIRSLEGGHLVKIACVSASVLPSERDEIAAAGFDDFLRKPYTAKAIFDCMARHLGVRYVFERSSTAASAVKEALSPEALASIPTDLRGELEKALVFLDTNRITAVTGRVSGTHPEIGRALTQHVDQFAFTPLLRILRNRQENQIDQNEYVPDGGASI